MVPSNTAWDILEQWSPIAFLVAGGLFAFPGVAYVFNTVTGTEIHVSPVIIFASLLVVFVGLLGLYPRLAERDSILALGGVGLLAVTAGVIISTVGVAVLPIEVTFGKRTMVAIIVTVTAGTILTFTMFGVASLQTGAYSRPVGGSLLVMAAGEACILAATMLYSNPKTTWVEFGVSVLFVASLGSISYLLRTETTPAKRATSTGDVASS